MDIKQLRYFVAAAEHFNFTVAARQVYVTQQALSLQISELERELEVALFSRNRHTTSLTAAGTALLREAKAIIEKADEAIQITRQAASRASGKLKLGYLGFAERNFLPQLIHQFRAKNPYIELSCQQMSNGMLDEALKRSDIDLGFIQIWDSSNIPGISWKKIYTDKLCLVVPANHPLADSNHLHDDELEKETYIFHPLAAPRGYHNLFRVCSNRGFTPEVSPVSDLLTVLMMIEAGFGVSLLPNHIPSGYASPSLRMVDFNGDDALINVAIAWNKSNTNPSIPLFITELESIC